MTRPNAKLATIGLAVCLLGLLLALWNRGGPESGEASAPVESGWRRIRFENRAYVTVGFGRIELPKTQRPAVPFSGRYVLRTSLPEGGLHEIFSGLERTYEGSSNEDGVVLNLHPIARSHAGVYILLPRPHSSAGEFTNDFIECSPHPFWAGRVELGPFDETGP